MAATPRDLLMVCRRNHLLHSICPSQVPSFQGSYQAVGFCYDRYGHDLLSGGHFDRLGSRRRVQGAGWGFEAGTPLPGHRHRNGGSDPLLLRDDPDGSGSHPRHGEKN